MNYLLDTHTLIWYLEGSPAISETAKELILNPANNIYVSHASFFEIAIKIKINKLRLVEQLDEFIETTKKLDIQVLPIEEKHFMAYVNLPLFEDHRDPFDRMIIAIGATDSLKIISKDSNFPRYSAIQVIW